jgi:hypothetical protein
VCCVVRLGLGFCFDSFWGFGFALFFHCVLKDMDMVDFDVAFLIVQCSNSFCVIVIVAYKL